jgi:hypothetical protein
VHAPPRPQSAGDAHGLGAQYEPGGAVKPSSPAPPGATHASHGSDAHGRAESQRARQRLPGAPAKLAHAA